jgi:hypothetical protein
MRFQGSVPVFNSDLNVDKGIPEGVCACGGGGEKKTRLEDLDSEEVSKAFY